MRLVRPVRSPIVGSGHIHMWEVFEPLAHVGSLAQQGWKRRRIYTRNVYIRVLYRENTIQYASCSLASIWRQPRAPLSKQTLPRINSANVRYFIEFAMILI